MNFKRPCDIYSTPQHIFAEIMHLFQFCRFGFFKRLILSIGILLDVKNMLNQDENKYSKRFRIVIKPGRSFIGYVIWEHVKGIVIWMFEEMC
jgi:hypothetical protein